jgi:hypothetical protein
VSVEDDGVGVSRRPELCRPRADAVAHEIEGVDLDVLGLGLISTLGSSMDISDTDEGSRIRMRFEAAS